MHQDTNNTSSVWLAPLWPTGASTFQKKIPPPAEFNAVSARMPDLLSSTRCTRQLGTRSSRWTGRRLGDENPAATQREPSLGTPLPHRRSARRPRLSNL